MKPQPLHSQEFVRRLWDRDASLWKFDPSARSVIENRLGWLTSVSLMREQAAALKAFAGTIRDEFRHVVLLGMGGSSLCPEVLQETFGAQPGYPALRVLDSTDPATIRSLERAVDLASTLFIVSSKSGTTLETDCFFRHFFERVKEIRGAQAGRSFVAITDGGTVLETLARDFGFRRCFVNPADIGGRYSALSYFGLVPAALLGIDLELFLERAAEMQRRCGVQTAASDNPGLELGFALADFYSSGKDKVSLIVTPAVATFGYWAEQLIAESTGKEGKGLVPVEGEALAAPAAYGGDRVFVYMRLADQLDRAHEDAVRALARAGHPVREITLRDRFDLAGEFFRWEFATAAASARIGINAFDEPNVKESKDNTARLLEEYKKAGRVPEPRPLLEEGGIRLFVHEEYARRLAAVVGRDIASVLEKHVAMASAGDYVALLAYLEPSAEIRRLLHTIRTAIRERRRTATTLGFGPRFLHSTGQLHKGGGNNGVFVQLTATDREDLAVPGMPFSFGTLKLAQSCGDMESLDTRKRRAVRLDLGLDAVGGLRKISEWLA